MAITLWIEPDWAHSCFTNIAFVLLLNWIHSFVLELAVASSGVWCVQGGINWTWLCYVCSYVVKKVKLLALYYLFFFIYREASSFFLGLKIEQHLYWLSWNLLQYWCGVLMSKLKVLSQSRSTRLKCLLIHIADPACLYTTSWPIGKLQGEKARRISNLYLLKDLNFGIVADIMLL